MFYDKLLNLESQGSLSDLQNKQELRQKYVEKVHKIVLYDSDFKDDRYIRSLAVELMNIVIDFIDSPIGTEKYPYACAEISRAFLRPLSAFTPVNRQDIIDAIADVNMILQFNLILPTYEFFLHQYLTIFNVKLGDTSMKIIQLNIKRLEILNLRLLPSICILSLLYHYFPTIITDIIVSTPNLNIKYSLEDVEMVADIIKVIIEPSTENVKDITESINPKLLRPSSFKPFVASIRSADVFKLRELGEGAYATIYEVKYNGLFYAMKELGCDNVPNDDAYLEIAYTQYMSNANILDAVGRVAENNCYSLIIDLMEMDLFDYTYRKSKSQGISHIEKRAIMQKILEGVRYMHSMGIIHGDLKMENILVSNNGRDIKIADFGTARLEPVANTGVIPFGTTYYLPIERLMGYMKYSYSFDSWSCGIFFTEFILEWSPFQYQGGKPDLVIKILEFVGAKRFYTLNYTEQYETILPRAKRVTVRGDMYNLLSGNFLVMVSRLLDFNKNSRANITEALSYII